LDQCVASDGFLEVLRASGRSTSEPTKTMYAPIECIRGALSTWIGAYDRTQAGKTARPFSMTEINRRLSPPQSADELGRLGDFRVLRLLGVGGFGVVFEAEDTQLKRRVALKLMHPAIAAKPGGVDRFLREAQSAAALKHEHVVTIYQVGTHGDTPFIALELLHGETLEDYLIREGRVGISEVVRIGREIASGLAVAHARGLLHRDIKPANIWLERPDSPIPQQTGPDDQHVSQAVSAAESGIGARAQGSAGKVKILDFGCAKSWADEVAISDQGLLIGTPAYMAPEQFSGEAVDPRTDLFSLGCVLYRMAAGRRPFGGDNVFSVVRALALEEPVPLQGVNPEVPRSLSDLVGRLLSKSLDARPATAQAVVLQLRSVEQSLSRQQGAERATAGQFATDSRRHRGLKKRSVLGAAIVLAALLSLVVFLFGAQLIRIATNKGQVVIKVNDPAVAITLTEDQIVIHDGKGSAEITLAAGDHEFDVTVKQPSGENKFKTDKFTLERGGRKVVEVEKELAKVVASQTPIAPKQPESRSTSVVAKDRPPQASSAVDLDRRVALWVLSVGGSVTVRAGHAGPEIQLQHGQVLPSSDLELTGVELKGATLRQSDLLQLKGLSHLEELVLSHTETTDAELEPLSSARTLKKLDVDFTRVTDASLAHLEHRTTFQSLSLRNTGVTDAGLNRLKELTALESLMLDGTHISNAGMIHLRRLAALRALSLSYTPVTDAGLMEIEGLSNLERLTLNATQLSDAGLVHLHHLNKLRRLIVNRTRVSDEGLRHLEVLPQLEWLSLNETRVTDAGLDHLRGLVRMRFLSLANLPITDSGLRTIQTLTSLDRLNLNATRVTDKGLIYLKGMTQLETLDLGATQITEAGLAELQALPNLRVLSLKGMPHLGDVTIARLLHLKSLKEVDLRDTHVSAKGFSVLRSLLPNAHVLWSEPNYSLASSVLSAGGSVVIIREDAPAELSVKKIGDLPAAPFRLTRIRLAGQRRSIGQLLPELPNPALGPLVSLDLSGSEIDDSDLQRLKPLVALRELNLANTRVTDAGLEALKGLTALRELVLDGDAIQGSGLMPLQELPELTTLRLGCPALKELFLVELAPLKKLERLSLANSPVSDEGSKHLAVLTHLKELDLSNTQMTAGGVARLKTSFPQCRIITIAAARNVATP
jgi:serine/threonine protein kinase/Leucine-rich repeat (LRR) protein